MSEHRMGCTCGACAQIWAVRYSMLRRWVRAAGFVWQDGNVATWLTFVQLWLDRDVAAMGNKRFASLIADEKTYQFLDRLAVEILS